MILYLLCCLIIIGLPIPLKRYKNGKKIYCLCVFICLLGIMGFRSFSLGQNDIYDNYVPIYNKIRYMSIANVVQIYSKDVIFYLFTKIITLFFSNAHVWLFIISFFYLFTVCYLVYSESKLPYLSFLIFISLNYYGFCFTILRHCIALTFVIWSFIFYSRGKKIKGILSWVIACCFHMSAVSFFIFFIIENKEISLKQLVYVFVCFILANKYIQDIVTLFFSFFTNERVSVYLTTNTVSSFNYTMLIMNLFLFLFALYNLYRSFSIGYTVKLKKLSNSNNIMMNFSNINPYYNSCIFNIICLCFISGWALMFRVAMFFGIFSIIFVPNCIYLNKNTIDRVIITPLLSMFLIYYFLFFASYASYINPYLSFLSD